MRMCVCVCLFLFFFTVKEIIASEIMELLINEVLLKLLAGVPTLILCCSIT